MRQHEYVDLARQSATVPWPSHTTGRTPSTGCGASFHQSHQRRLDGHRSPLVSDRAGWTIPSTIHVWKSYLHVVSNYGGLDGLGLDVPSTSSSMLGCRTNGGWGRPCHAFTPLELVCSMSASCERTSTSGPDEPAPTARRMHDVSLVVPPRMLTGSSKPGAQDAHRDGSGGAHSCALLDMPVGVNELLLTALAQRGQGRVVKAANMLRSDRCHPMPATPGGLTSLNKRNLFMFSLIKNPDPQTHNF